MSWKEGQVPVYVWISRADLGAKETRYTYRKLKSGKFVKVNRKSKSRLCVGKVKCWTIEPIHELKKWACYKLVPNKSKVVKSKLRRRGVRNNKC